MLSKTPWKCSGQCESSPVFPVSTWLELTRA